MEIYLNNAQSGGPQLQILEDGVVKRTIWLRAMRKEDKGIYFSTGQTSVKSLNDFPMKDGIPIYPLDAEYPKDTETESAEDE